MNLQDRQVPGTISHSADTPRSYHVNIPSGQVRRNRRDLRPRQQSRDPPDSGTGNTSNLVMTRSHTGASMNPPDRLTSDGSELKRGDVICVYIIIIIDLVC